MSGALQIVEHVHGHLGWLAALALIHPAVLLRRRERRAQLACALSTGVVTLTGALGAWMYADYRARLKQAIFLHAPRIGWAFERKEHLAVGAIVLAWAGLAAHVAATRSEPRSLRDPLARAAHVAYVAAAVLAFAASGLGLLVATYRTF